MTWLHDVYVCGEGPRFKKQIKEQIEALDRAIAGMKLAIRTTPDLGSEEKNAAARRDLREAKEERVILQLLLAQTENPRPVVGDYGEGNHDNWERQLAKRSK